MTNPDPAADIDLRDRLLKAARRQASPTRIDKSVVGGDRARVIKMIVSKWGIKRGDYVPDAPTGDELVNLCIATPVLRHGFWMLYMSRSRASLDLAYLIKRPTSVGGLPAKQIQVIENDLTGPAWDTYQGLRVMRENVGLVVRLGERGLFVYSMLKMVPPVSGSVTFCLGNPADENDWRAIFPLEALLGIEPE
jgi:hypothetical protein